MGAKNKVAVHVVVDTNFLFTEAADKLLANEISDLISSSSSNLELNVRWYLPWIVKAERQYQMLLRANRLIPHLQKIEKLLGHQLGITEDVLHTRVSEAIQRQIELYKLNEISFDQADVDWQQMVEKSVFRLAPFDPGESEKGFRDAILLETFCQLAKTLPKTAAICRIVLLSNDELLLQATQARLQERNNIFPIGELESLKTMLNALAAELTQETVNSVLPKAKLIFFDPENNDNLYYKAEVRQKILEKFGAELSRPPEAGYAVVISGTRIAAPTFLTKSGQTLRFSSRIIFKLEATKYVSRPNDALWSGPGTFSSSVLSGADLNRLQFGLAKASNPPQLGLGALIAGAAPSGNLAVAGAQIEELKRNGEAVFEVDWSVTLKSNGGLVAPKFSQVSYKSTEWKT